MVFKYLNCHHETCVRSGPIFINGPKKGTNSPFPFYVLFSIFVIAVWNIQHIMWLIHFGLNAYCGKNAAWREKSLCSSLLCAFALERENERGFKLIRVNSFSNPSNLTIRLYRINLMYPHPIAPYGHTGTPLSCLCHVEEDLKLNWSSYKYHGNL